MLLEFIPKYKFNVLNVFLLFLILILQPNICNAWENYRPITKDVYVQAWEDGNILIVNDKNKSDKNNFAVRFYGIGIPTLKQPFGSQAKKELAELLPKGSKVIISTIKTDEEGIVSALVQYKDHSVNNRLIELGLAWVDRSTCKAFFCRRWHIQEHIAVKDKRGIWSLKINTPPWQWGE